MAKVIVNGAVIGKNDITLFFADGGPTTYPQNDWRTGEIMEKVGPALASQGSIEIDLDEYSTKSKAEAMTGSKVTEDAGGKAIIHRAGHAIPAEALQQHIDRATVDGSKGLKKFLDKFDIIKRPYTKDELLKFLQGADLPFMDDGSILGFKILREDEANTGYMVDKHSGLVRQKLGSLVYMPESKVDQSRALCSTGLHIAARRYLGGFWSSYGRAKSMLCLVKIQPKDVVSVPYNESTKMRVSAYHIIKVFSDEDAAAIVGGKDIHDLPAALQLLEEAVAGNHTPIVQTVEVTGYGNIAVKDLIVTDRTEKRVRKARVSRVSPKQIKLVNPAHINAMKKLVKLGRPVEKWNAAYTKKMVEAQVLLDKGKLSLREIAKKLGIDRDSMTANLDRRPRRTKVA